MPLVVGRDRVHCRRRQPLPVHHGAAVTDRGASSRAWPRGDGDDTQGRLLATSVAASRRSPCPSSSSACAWRRSCGRPTSSSSSACWQRTTELLQTNERLRARDRGAPARRGAAAPPGAARRAHRPSQPAPALRPPRAGDLPVQPLREAAGAPLHGSERFQGGQRHLRPSLRRRTAAPGGRPPPEPAPHHRHGGAARRRRVRHPAAGDRGPRLRRPGSPSPSSTRSSSRSSSTGSRSR